MEKLIQWLEAHQLPCFYKHFLGIECPGCGMQTAFILLLKGNILESLKAYPAMLPIVFMVNFLILHLLFDFRKGASILKFSFIFTVVILVINYAVKLIFISY